jgi:rod shape-determining protein MreD
MRASALRDVVSAGAAVLAAFAAYSLMGGFGPSALAVVNGFSLVVVVFAVRKGEVFGGVLGSVCGLVQDSFSLGVFGVAGLTKTLLGFWTGYVSRRVDIGPPARSAALLLVMSSLELVLWVLLSAVALGERPNVQGGLLVLQPLMTAVLGSGLLFLLRRLDARGA